MSDQTPQQPTSTDQPVAKQGAYGASQPGAPNPLIPKSAINKVNNLSQKLSTSAEGVDDVADNLEKMMVKGLDTTEKKLNGLIDGLDKLLGKF